MIRNNQRGFSILEVIAAVVILAVVAAATVATVAPIRAKSVDKLADREIAALNAMSQTFFRNEGHYPSSVVNLVDAGYIASASADDQARLNQIRRSYHYSHSTGVFSKK